MRKVNLFGLMALLSLQFGALAQTITTSVAPTTSVVSANPLMELRQLTPSIYQRIPLYDPSIEFYPSMPPSFKSDLSFVRGTDPRLLPQTIHQWDLNSGGSFTFSYRSGTNSFVTPLIINSTGLQISGNLILKGTNGSTQFKVFNNGSVRAREVKVDLLAIPDYVFKPDYKLMSLPELEKFIKQYNHLPNVPSEQEYKDKGEINIGELNTKLLEKVEELTLYLIELQKKVEVLEKQLNNSK
jgi:hypothetical protein